MDLNSGIVRLVLVAGLALGTVANACSKSEEQLASGLPPLRADLRPLVEGELSPDGLKVILGTGDLSVGPNRFMFVLTSPDGFVTEPEVWMSLDFVDRADAHSGVLFRAEFRRWPYGSRGSYTSDVVFDRSGRWRMRVSVSARDEPRRVAGMLFDVAQQSSAVAVGDTAVRSITKTIADVATLGELTTGSVLDPDLYELSIRQAVESLSPSVIVFASPAFCTNAVCGPQVEVLQKLKDTYKGFAHFVHVDFYDNPQEVQGDLDNAVLSPAVIEWGLPSIEWTFVVDREGRVSARFEGFATLSEIQRALLDVL